MNCPVFYCRIKSALLWERWPFPFTELKKINNQIEDPFLSVNMSYHVGCNILDYLAMVPLFWARIWAMFYLVTSQIDCFVVIYQRSPASSPEVIPEVPPGNCVMMVGGKQPQTTRRQLNPLFPLWSNLPPFYWRSLIAFVRVLVAARMRSAWWPWSHLLTNWMGCTAWWVLCSFAICVCALWATAVDNC